MILLTRAAVSSEAWSGGPLGGSSSRSSRRIPCVSEQPGITTGTYFFKALEQDYIFFSYIFSNRCLWDGTSHLV